MSEKVPVSQHIDLAKIVATPQPNAWSQTYNAGKLFALLSFAKKEEDVSLPMLGKETITTLESEFFSLEEKNLAAIEHIALTIVEKLPKTISCSLVIAALIDSILYIVTTQNGDVFIKRGGTFGIITQEKTEHAITSFSGYVQNNDCIILATRSFLDSVSSSILTKTLENATPSQIEENLIPLIHEKEDGSIAALVLLYHEESIPFVEQKDESFVQSDAQENNDIRPALSETPNKKRSFGIAILKNKGKQLTQLFLLRGKRLLFLTIAVILILILIFNVLRTVKNQQANTYDALFNQIYPQVQKEYEQGQSLSDLNTSLAHDSFAQAQGEISQNINKFPKNSTQWTKLNELLQKVNQALGESGAGQTTKTNLISLDQSPILKAENDQNSLFATENDTTIFLLNTDGVTTLDKKTQKQKHIIDKSWATPAGLGTYLTNIYIVDSKGTINKYVVNDSGYSKQNYFGGNTTPDLSRTTGLAIDGSLWVLTRDGAIMKFTRGTQDSFALSGLATPLKNPTRIFTNDQTNNLYVLDNGNSRIVVFDKTGAYKQSYNNTILQNAKDFVADEQNKKIFILSNTKLYEIDL